MAYSNKKISELTTTAIKLSEIDYNIPFKRYLRASKEIMRTADYYYHDQQLEQAFILYSKYCTLFVEKLPKHPEYKSFGAFEKKTYSINLKDSFKKAEVLKEELLLLYEKKYQEEQINLHKIKTDVVERENVGTEKSKVVHENLDGDREDEMRVIEARFNNIKTIEQSCIPQVVSAPMQAPHVPEFNRSLKPAIDLTTQTVVETLRTVLMPSNVAVAFLNAVKQNSVKNIETCGVVLGDLHEGKWKVKRLLLPQQIGSSDNCDISNEEEIIAYQDHHNLITLGWIHTHPSQTAFLSSVDQHTHWPYQKFFPEAIAIVSSPKYNETGYFNLSEEGMSYIGDCKGRGFHQHPSQPPLFQNCGHIEFDFSYHVLLDDLRR